MKSSTRVIFNVSVQYIRTILSVFITLYTSRVILDALGETDYGIYSLVGGVVFMLSFIQSSLTSTTQRFLSYYHGSNDVQKQKEVFQNSLFIQLFAAIFIIGLLFSISPFLFNGFLNIPIERVYSAKIIYYGMLVILLFAMISTPFLATLIARENILYMSIVLLIKSVLKIPVALSLYYVDVDKLILYVLLLIVLQMIEFVMYYIYCRRNYGETKDVSIKNINIPIIKEIFSFMGWSIYGTGCVVGRNQGIAVVLNKFFGSGINAAYGISWQVSGQLNFLSNSIQNAIKPRLVRYEGADNRKMMLRTSEIMSKFSYLLLLCIAIPLIIEMPTLLSLWLKNVPDFTILFCRCIVVTSLIDQLTCGLGYANQAVGNLKYYAIFVSTIKLLTLPISIIFLIMNYQPDSVMYTIIFIEALCALVRLPVLKKLADLSIVSFLRKVFLKEVIPSILTILFCLIFVYNINVSYRFIYTIVVSVVTMMLSTFFWGLCEDEKQIIINLFRNILKINKNVNQ